jgi:hypothetical protein
VLALGCGRAPSDGSTLEGPRALAVGPDGVIDLQLPADTRSVTFLATGPGSAPLSLEIRSGQHLLTDGQAPESSLNRLLPGPGLLTAVLPSGSAVLPLASRYAIRPMRLEGASGDPVMLSAWVKRGPPPAVQELPLSVVLIGRAPAGLGAGLAIALGELGRIWREVGIEIGEPAVVAVDGPAQVSIDPTLGSDSPAVGAALSLSARAPAGTLALVLVGALPLGGTGESLLALAGGIPVPPLGGTARSGVLVNAPFVAHDPIWAGQVIAHEVGHALGLYHSTERATAGGAIHDPIADTPECPAEADVDHDGTLAPSECDGHDAANLMFWATARNATRLTAGQAELARRSALVR